MSHLGFTVLESRHVPDTRNTEITVSAPDLERVIVTVPDSLVGSALIDEVIRRALEERRKTTDALRPMDE